jgi:hypothetical protein
MNAHRISRFASLSAVVLCLFGGMVIAGTGDGSVIGTTKIVDNGPASDRFNIVILSDGYTQAQLAQFHADAQQYVDFFLNTPPFNTNCTAFNFYRIDVASTESGADDPVETDDHCTGGTGATAATYFDATFCSDGVIRRLLGVNNGTATNVLNAQVPEWNLGLVIVNSEIYGGSGGSIGTTSLAGTWENIAVHETGHSAFGLADEYEYYAGCGVDTDRDNHPASEPSEPNVTTETDRNLVKWHELILPATAVPTTSNADCSVCDPQGDPTPGQTIVGLYEGAHYYHCDAFRPAFDCMMRNFAPYCPVCTRRILDVLEPYQPGEKLTLPGGVDFGDTCVGDTSTETLNVCNTGTESLDVSSIASSNSQFTVVTPTSGFPVTISPDFCFPFQVKFTPTSAGAKTTTFTVDTSLADLACAGEVEGTGTGTVPRITTLIPDSGSFGEVCRGAIKDLPLTINNSGGCDLAISGISSSSADFQVAMTLSYPIIVGPGDSIAVPIRLAPSTLGAKAGNITVFSNDPTTPAKVVAVSGSVPPGDVRVTGSTDFGDVCGGTQAEKEVSVCNVGACNLNVTSVGFEPPCPDFTLINNPFPAAVSPDSCESVVIRFTPTSDGPKTCTLVIRTDDPDTPQINKTVTANTPEASIDVPPDLGFPPTVLSSVGACVTPEPFPVSNTGDCPLKITGFAIVTDSAEYSISGLPSFPIILEAGHEAGEGDLTLDFAPDNLGRAQLGSVRVTYVSDAITGATTDVTRALCGEGVRTGARVLVTAGGVPLASVEQIKLQRINANRNKNLLDTVDTSRNLTLQSSVPPAPCAPFQYHREYSTVSNPIQLLPGSYQVTVTAIVNGKRQKKSVGFDVNTCGFNPTIVVNF